MKKKYNFEIIFRKLDELKLEHTQFNKSDYELSKEIDEQIKELKSYYEDLTIPDVETYTRS